MRNNTVDILIVIRWPVGGIISFLSNLLRCFDSERYRFTVLAPENSEIHILLQRLSNYNVKYVPIKPRPTFGLFWKETTRLILKNNFHLVHSQGLTAGVSSVFGCILSRTPHLLTLHDMFQDSNFKGSAGHLKATLLSILLSLIDSIHLVSNDAFENLLAYLPFLKKFKRKLFVSRNGIQVSHFLNSPRRDLRKELGITEDTFIIGFLGRFMSPKGFSYLIDALNLLSLQKDIPRAPIVLAFGHDGFLREEITHIKKCGLKDYFRFLPFAPDVAPILRGLDVLAVPSLWEACAILPMEAMVAGTPVIGSDCIGLREVLSDTPSKIFHAKDSTSLAKALIEEMRYSSKEKAEAFRKEAARRFDAKNQAKTLEKIICNLIQSSSREVGTCQ
jgi:glycosyltransferase involved in cell wall biosynthesis